MGAGRGRAGGHSRGRAHAPAGGVAGDTVQARVQVKLGGVQALLQRRHLLLRAPRAGSVRLCGNPSTPTSLRCTLLVHQVLCRCAHVYAYV